MPERKPTLLITPYSLSIQIPQAYKGDDLLKRHHHRQLRQRQHAAAAAWLRP
jgi:hypothetical protein